VGDLKRQYPTEQHRPLNPSRKYNCHALSFASRRTWISTTSEIAKIIGDDDYRVVDLPNVLPGDIAVYYKDGDAEHSAIVVRVDAIGNLRIPVVLSKCGCNRFKVRGISRL
jgi:hypothetical protein